MEGKKEGKEGRDEGKHCFRQTWVNVTILMVVQSLAFLSAKGKGEGNPLYLTEIF